MPLFFFFSGYCFKTAYLDNPKGFLLKRIYSVYWPYVKWSILFLLCHNLFFNLNIYNGEYGFRGSASHLYSLSEFASRGFDILTRMSGHEQLLGGYWFMKSMLFGSIIFFETVYACKKIHRCSMVMGGVKMLCYRKPSTEDYYLSSFLLGISLRENCFSCQYAKPERVSDLTIGDFIGLGKNTPFEHSTKNVSSVTTNTSKGEDFYKEVMDYMPELMSLERDYRERLAYKPSLVKPFGRHPLNEDFRALYPQYGFVKAIRIVLRNTIRKNRVKRRLSGWTYIYRIPRKLFRIITKRSDITEYEQLSNKTDYTKRAQTH